MLQDDLITYQENMEKLKGKQERHKWKKGEQRKRMEAFQKKLKDKQIEIPEGS